MKFISSGRSKIIAFFLFFIAISLCYDYNDSINDPPYSVHHWRQADAISMTTNYYEEGMNFFEPKIHNQDSQDGKAVGEFPIIYFINAVIWKLTGPSHFTARLLHLILVFLGLFALYKSILLVLKDAFCAFVIPMLLFSAPLYGFYANNFLVNLPALSLVFISWYYFLSFGNERKTIYLVCAVLIATLAGLLRPTMLIGVFPIYAIVFFELTGLLKVRLFTKNHFHTLFLFFPLMALLAWILISKNYNETHNSVYFLTTIRPIWEMESVEIWHVWSVFKNKLVPEFFHSSIIFMLFLMIIGFVLKSKTQSNYLRITIIIIGLGLWLYLLLWFKNLGEHDYYLIELYLIVPVVILAFCSYIKDNYIDLFSSLKARGVVLVILSFSFCYGITKTRIKHEGNKDFLTQAILSEEEIEFWRWFHGENDYTLNTLETITPYLRSLGIDRKDFVVSFPDPSPNITLSAMDQKGFTSLYYGHLNPNEKIKYFIERGAKYLIINDPRYYEQENISDFTNKKLGSYKNVDIFRLEKSSE